jgi:predicted  nucleic acid-binding Zn-ribbon protein
MPIEQYIDAHTSILHKCVIDGHVWSVTPGSILSGYGCPKCAGNAKKTHDEYVQEVSIINPDIEVTEPYIGANVSILHRCKKDGCTWSARPTNILNGTGCPFCRESRGEKQIAQWFETNKIKYVYQKKFIDCRDKKQLPFDFYLSQFNICIEYDGLQHFQPVDFAGKGESWAITQFKMVQKHDDIKTRYCHNNNNISLVRIPYFANINEELEKFFIHLI